MDIIKIHNPGGQQRVVVTKELPGVRWLELLTDADCRVELHHSTAIFSMEDLKHAIGDQCYGVIGQLTEKWDRDALTFLNKCGGNIFCNYAVGYNNVDITAASELGIAVGNTPGVLTETTAELAVALTLTAARRIVEADGFTRSGRFSGWLPKLFLGELLSRKTLGIIGMGHIGAAYARMMVYGFNMNLVYFDPRPNSVFEKFLDRYAEFLARENEKPILWKRVDSIEKVLEQSDVVSLHPILHADTYHMIGASRLASMKDHAILINVSRGAVIDEAALVKHCQTHPFFRVGLDVYEDEPLLAEGLESLPNIVIVPHIGSASQYTRESMAIISALNIIGVKKQFPLWKSETMIPFLSANPPAAVPSIVNWKELGLE
jgi:hydroxypyruvate reductase 1